MDLFFSNSAKSEKDSTSQADQKRRARKAMAESLIRRRSLWRQGRFYGLLILFVLLLVTFLGNQAGIPEAHAAAYCQVTYTVTNQWSGGFGGTLTIQNTSSSAWSSWSLAFTFPASGQSVTQLWNGTVSQSGQNVTVVNASYNGSVAANAFVNPAPGFNGTWTGSNPVPTNFSVNGNTCNASSTTTPTPTTGTTPTATPTTGTTPTPTTTPGDPWNPPSNLVTPLALTWQHMEDTYTDLYGFKNYIWDQIMASHGSINYCVRWDSNASVTATLRDQIQANLARSFNKWIAAMLDNGQGWDAWPYTSVSVKVVGWAVRDRSLLQWTDNSVDIYVNDINENAPECAQACGRFFHQDGNYSSCPGGALRHYDMSLWLTSGMTGGAGGDWGQRIGSEYLVDAINANTDNIHILLHEMGHGYGLDDFYDWQPPGVCCFLMNAGTATQITDFDKWMLRDFWRHIKSRYGL